MLDGVMLLWFVLVALSLLYVVVDIRATPEAPVLKWGFVLLTAYIGPFGAFLYVLGCREPLPGLHERYVATRWRQVLGSTMHCVAGDGLGIIAGAVIASRLRLHGSADIGLEYVLGFGFGWGIFQALAMRGMAGGSYKRSLAITFFPELLSMNFLMAGMVPTMILSMSHVPAAMSPLRPEFWFVMSMALLVGFITAYPMNWWLVSHHMKHGMMTVPLILKSQDDATDRSGHMHHAPSEGSETERPESISTTDSGPPTVATSLLAGMTLVSFMAFGVGLTIATVFGGM